MTLCRWMLVFALFSAWAASAQEQQQDVIVHKEFNVTVGTPAVGTVMAPIPQGRTPEHTFQFIAAEMGFNNKVVKGKPYSAEAVTETSQALADGNRITRKMSASVYRDGEGRTRREQTLGMIGPFKPQGAPPVTITIEDPVAGVHYLLDPQGKVAVKLPLRMPESGITAKQQTEHVTEVRMRAPGGGAPPHAAVAGMASAGQVFYQRMAHSGQS